ncbi:Methyltransferase domain-containing protein [Paenibacillus uliginis N3/975]|uniref:Methyltransferase domain-containing protein n=1 Tax=Paenibacillus uliginis N3/975 TaxID=1313296 RepID=A0A1X7HJR6_9BACL|nr:class I SAM-dependent methyltransferase [Paenibacillus uliginis]SMF87791.1 Methyltransferase domain-containing protein [Paenibacillus uliginis N3/975]
MSDYYWDKQIEYLRKTRWLYYNDDYLDFLVKGVWKIDKPVNIIDYGCGYGFLGLKLLPLLPEGSTYTGIDKGTDLINRAKEIFLNLPYPTEFKVVDIEEMDSQPMYDIAICHAFLLHMTDSRKIVQKMIDHVFDNGKVICFEPHWIANSSNYYVDSLDQSQYIRLGILQKLFEEDSRLNGKDGNIGIQLPIILSQLGLDNVECRVSDRVNFLDQNMDLKNKEKLFDSLREEGLGKEPECLKDTLNNLMNRGLTHQEASDQHEAELLFSREFGPQSWLTYAPNMKISFGTVKR